MYGLTIYSCCEELFVMHETAVAALIRRKYTAECMKGIDASTTAAPRVLVVPRKRFASGA
eukprot:scaffold77640_cov35-Prasinocladus_malaysianus.AAC.6